MDNLKIKTMHEDINQVLLAHKPSNREVMAVLASLTVGMCLISDTPYLTFNKFTKSIRDTMKNAKKNRVK